MIHVGFSIASSSFPMKRHRTFMSQGLGRACCQYVQDNTIQFTCIYKSITTIQASLDFAKNAIDSKDKDIGDYYCYLIFKEQDRLLQYSFPVLCQPIQKRIYPPSQIKLSADQQDFCLQDYLSFFIHIQSLCTSIISSLCQILTG